MSVIPENSIIEYDLSEVIENGWVFGHIVSKCQFGGHTAQLNVYDSHNFFCLELADGKGLQIYIN